MNNAWILYRDQIVAFGRDLVRAGVLEDADAVLEYFQKPDAFQTEHEWWEANGRPDDPGIWEDGALSYWGQSPYEKEEQ